MINTLSKCNMFIASPAFTQWRHIGITIRRLATGVVIDITKNFCHSFLWNHISQPSAIWHEVSVWGPIPCKRVWDLSHAYFLLECFCRLENFCHIFLRNHVSQPSAIELGVSVWGLILCKRVWDLTHANCLFDQT